MDEQKSECNSIESGEPPAVTINYGVFEVAVYGGSGDSLEKVEEATERRVEEAMKNIEELKRMDYDLSEEYTEEDDRGPTGRMSQ